MSRFLPLLVLCCVMVAADNTFFPAWLLPTLCLLSLVHQPPTPPPSTDQPIHPSNSEAIHALKSLVCRVVE